MCVCVCVCVCVCEQEEVLVEVNQKVEQLAGMMERMSARFVLLETQLKTIQTRPSGAGRKETKEGDTKREEREWRLQICLRRREHDKRIHPSLLLLSKELLSPR